MCFLQFFMWYNKRTCIAKWLIESELHNTMKSSVNMQMATYNKAVVPACSICNNSILAYIENHIIKVIETIDTLNSSGDEDLCNIIRWMEVIDYKLQVLDCRRKYIKYGNWEYDRLWGIFPVAMMRHFSEMNPWIAYDWLRNSQWRITVKAKIVGINSLVILKTRVRHFDFFTQPNEYIYISFPMYNVSLFYFIKKRYDDYENAAAEALRIIKQVTESWFTFLSISF